MFRPGQIARPMPIECAGAREKNYHIRTIKELSKTSARCRSEEYLVEKLPAN